MWIVLRLWKHIVILQYLEFFSIANGTAKFGLISPQAGSKTLASMKAGGIWPKDAGGVYDIKWGSAGCSPGTVAQFQEYQNQCQDARCPYFNNSVNVTFWVGTGGDGQHYGRIGPSCSEHMCLDPGSPSSSSSVEAIFCVGPGTSSVSVCK